MLPLPIRPLSYVQRNIMPVAVINLLCLFFSNIDCDSRRRVLRRKVVMNGPFFTSKKKPQIGHWRIDDERKKSMTFDQVAVAQSFDHGGLTPNDCQMHLGPRFFLLYN